MPKTCEVTIKVSGLPEARAAQAEAVAAAVAAQRRRLVTLVRATCACQRCKDDVARLLSETEAG